MRKKTATKVAVKRNKSSEVVRTLRRENTYLRKRVAALEAREALLMAKVLESDYIDFDSDWKKEEKDEEVFDKAFYIPETPYKSVNRTSVNTLVKQAKDKHEASWIAAVAAAKRQEAEVESNESEPKDVEVRIGDAKKKFYIENATAILNGKG